VTETGVGAARLLALAREVQQSSKRELVGVWPRAVAFLTRQALEEAVAEVLAIRAAGAEQCAARAQLLCLSTYAPTNAAHEAAYLWSVLSRACHHHSYELAPTTVELQRWMEAVERLIDSLWSSRMAVT
jgi:cytochrome c5